MFRPGFGRGNETEATVLGKVLKEHCPLLPDMRLMSDGSDSGRQLIARVEVKQGQTYVQAQRCSFTQCEGSCRADRLAIRKCGEKHDGRRGGGGGGFGGGPPAPPANCSHCGLATEVEVTEACASCSAPSWTHTASNGEEMTVRARPGVGLVADPLEDQEARYPWVLVNTHAKVDSSRDSRFRFLPDRDAEGFNKEPVMLLGSHFGFGGGGPQEDPGIFLRFNPQEKYLGLTRENWIPDPKLWSGGGIGKCNLEEGQSLSFHTPPGAVLKDGDRYLLRGQGPVLNRSGTQSNDQPSDITIYLVESEPGEGGEGASFSRLPVEGQWAIGKSNFSPSCDMFKPKGSSRGFGNAAASMTYDAAPPPASLDPSEKAKSARDRYLSVAEELRVVASKLRECSHKEKDEEGTTQAGERRLVGTRLVKYRPPRVVLHSNHPSLGARGGWN